ncbi:MAG: Ig-like domain-containing protein [Pseudomonadota bacterium]
MRQQQRWAPLVAGPGSILLALIVLVGCGGFGDDEPLATIPNSKLEVTVTDHRGEPMAGVDIVLTDAQGDLPPAPSADEGTGVQESHAVTDAEGRASLANPRPNAQVYALAKFPDAWGYTYYIVQGYTNVNSSSVGFILPNYTPLGSVRMYVRSKLPDIEFWRLWHGGALGLTAQSLTAYLLQADVQTDGGVTLMADGYYVNFDWAGYGREEIYGLAEQSADWAGGMDLTRTDLTTFTESFVDVPADSYYLQGQWRRIKKGVITLGSHGDFFSSIPNINLRVSTVSTGQDYWYLETFAHRPDGLRHRIRRRMDDPSGRTYLFDFTKVGADITGSEAVDPAKDRPTIAWTGGDEQASLSLSWESGDAEVNYNKRIYKFEVELPSGAQTYVFPELPDDLAEFRPGAWNKDGDYGDIRSERTYYTDQKNGAVISEDRNENHQLSGDGRDDAAGTPDAIPLDLTREVPTLDLGPASLAAAATKALDQTDGLVFSDVDPPAKPQRQPVLSSDLGTDGAVKPYVRYTTYRLYSLTGLLFQDGAPTMSSTSPENGAAGVDRNAAEISFTFNEAMGPHDVIDIDDNWIGDIIDIKWSSDRRTLTITRDQTAEPLPAETVMTFVLNPAGYYRPGYIFTDYFGTPFQKDYVFSFTTGS